MARLRIFILFCALLPLVLSQCTKETARVLFKRSVYEFSFELLPRIAQETEAHFVCSTISPWTLLASISLGATDNTFAELKRVLKLNSKKCFNDKYLEIIKHVIESDSEATLERSSSLFLDSSMELKEHFRRKLTNTGVCKVTPLDFNDFAVAAAEINNYVKQTTHGIIEDIVSPNDLEGVYCILIDALYFKGTWRTIFPAGNTKLVTFFDSHEVPIGEVNLMVVKGQFNLASINVIQARVLELPYGNSGRFSMLIFLPDKDISVYNVIDSLKKISLSTIFNTFKREGPETVNVEIPRFKISSDLDNLKEWLADMGLHDTFDSSAASFPDISNYQIYVSSFIQKADIEVTEEGTVAASATELSFSFRTIIIPESFVANKPFFFMVVDRQIEVPIFSGAYSKPTSY